MSAYKVEYLADHPEHIEACAAWDYGHWDVRKPEAAFQKTLNTFKNGAQTNRLPLTVVAIDNERSVPIGMGSLWEQDGPNWSDRSPWIASIFVHYRYRKQGLAKALVARLEEEAKKLGFPNIYLHSGSAAGLYKKLGYEELETIAADSSVGTSTLFRKNLL